MIKVLFMIHTLGHGGAEKVLVNLVNNMNQEKFDITVMTIFDTGVNKQFLKEHIKYKYCFKHIFRGNIHFLKIFTPTFLYKHFIKDDYDIVVSYLEGLSARIISGCPNRDTKLVSWIHIQQYERKNASRSFRSYEEAKKCYEKFDKVVCVSNSVKNDFCSLFPLKEKCIVLYNTNETDKIKDLANDNKLDISFEKDFFYICGIGKLLHSKGFDRILNIHRRLIKEGFKIKTIILGIGPDKNKLEKHIKNYHLEDSFFLLGYQVNPYKYLKHSNLFVCASYAEGFSTAATEALILGVPVLTTDVAGMFEMLGKNEYGIIVPNNDEALYSGIKEYLESESKQKYYKKQAVIRGEDFSTKKTTHAVEDMLIKLLK